MPILATAGESKSHTPAPSGLHQAVCVDAIDMGVLEVTYSGKTKKQHKIRLAWQIDELRDDGKRFVVQKRYTCSLHEKATLRKELESWRGKPFTEDELRGGFDLEKLLGVNCQINVQHVQAQSGETYANVVSIVPLGKGMTKIAALDYVRDKDRTDSAGDTSTEPLTIDDIPFAWLMPLILPALFAVSLWA